MNDFAKTLDLKFNVYLVEAVPLQDRRHLSKGTAHDWREASPFLVSPMAGLKGLHWLAQGNALGNWVILKDRPERATESSSDVRVGGLGLSIDHRCFTRTNPSGLVELAFW